MTTLAGLTIDLADAALNLVGIAAVLLGSAILKRSPTRAGVAACLGVVGTVWLSGLACGFISLAALRIHFPLVDDRLHRLDSMLGLDAPRFAQLISTAPHKAQQLLALAYTGTAGVLILSLTVASVTRRPGEAWRGAFCFVGTLLTTCLISTLTPARGIGLWLTKTTLARLPAGSARYFWDTFGTFYEGSQHTAQIASLDGVVCFPSFHIITGLIVVALWRAQLPMLVASSVWFATMVASTIPIGGHYFTDLFGGIVIWGIWFTLSRKLAPEKAAAAPGV